MRIGVFAKTFPGSDPDNVIAACVEAGFTSIQYNMACSGLPSLPVTIPDAAVLSVVAALRASNAEIAAVSATYNMTDPDHRRKQAGRHAFAAIAAIAGRLGTNLVTVCSGSKDPQDQWRRHPDNDAPASWTEMCREFEAMLPHAEKHDLLIGVEPEHANIVNSASSAARLLREFAGSPIRIVLDPANILEDVPADRHNATLGEAFDLLGTTIALAHAKDRHADGRVAPAGLGIVDWKHVLSGLAAVGFRGHLIAHGMSAGEAPDVARFLRHEISQL